MKKTNCISQEQTERTKRKFLYLSFLCALLLNPLALRADIIATVYPGYVLSDGETITVDILNQLGTPTVSVTGTLGGTNVAIGANTISGTMLTDTVVDGTTITFNASAPRALQVPSTALGMGLYGGSGATIHVKPDKSTVTTNSSGQLALVAYANSVMGATTNATPTPTNLVLSPYFTTQGNATNYTLAPVQFISTNINVIPDGTNVNFPHGLGTTPAWVRVVMLCTTADTATGYAVGDEIPSDLFTTGDVSGALSHAFGVICNSSNVCIIRNGVATLQTMRKTTGITYTTVTSSSNWRLKIYARP